jgi:hypothetical protein
MTKNNASENNSTQLTPNQISFRIVKKALIWIAFFTVIAIGGTVAISKFASPPNGLEWDGEQTIRD